MEIVKTSTDPEIRRLDKRAKVLCFLWCADNVITKNVLNTYT